MWEPIRETSSHATRQETLGNGLLRPLNQYGPILALRVELVCRAHLHFIKKKKNQRRRGMNCGTFPKKPSDMYGWMSLTVVASVSVIQSGEDPGVPQ